MMRLLSRLFPATETISPAVPGDAAMFASLHAACFRRGWTEAEFEQLLLDHRVVGQRALLTRQVVGFAISRVVAGEAEILSLAVARPRRGRGLAGRLLDDHLRTLAGLGTHTVLLEVDDSNVPARRLYARRHFQQVGERRGYYPRPMGEASSTALVLRRDLTPQRFPFILDHSPLPPDGEAL
jgi:[ribosomal protein S18]-alanine N-acetyltransferase